MTYDVEVNTGQGWAVDMTVAGRHGKRRATERLRDLINSDRGLIEARVLDRHGRVVTR